MKSTQNLAQQLGNLLTAHRLKITTAESCTGGGIAKRITDIAGSSNYFDMGFITYSNQAKSSLLAIDMALIDKYGAVSKQVAEAMATGALARANSDLAVSVTGIAGPGGGTQEKPVGTVWIALAWRNQNGEATVKANQYRFSGNRLDVREATTDAALNLSIDWINSKT